MKKIYNLGLLLLLFNIVGSIDSAMAQESVARKWNEALLQAIREDYARPTVHARNLFHTSLGMYDAWAAYDNKAIPFFLGREMGGFYATFTGIELPSDIEAAREKAISYAAYRILMHRFENSPGASLTLNRFDSLFTALGYDKDVTTESYWSNDPAALGNYIAAKIIEFGLQDGSNEEDFYENQYYLPVNEAMILLNPGNPNLSNPNRWQPLAFDVFIDQAGNEIPGKTPDFLGPEWGEVVPFALPESVLKKYERDNYEYWVYHDPGTPPYIDTLNGGALSDQYKWNFSLVSIWSSHLDATDGVMLDISPASIGNIQSFPTNWEDFDQFYNTMNGGDPGMGRDMNPVTGMAYEPQIVPRADYARVLAEFWADGPDSETPPGHWFTLLNYVNDHPELEKKFKGTGDVLDDLEWDVKSYLIMGGTVHDAAISAWGIKGWYDYIRPISAIRGMAEKGQSSDQSKANYHIGGLPIEVGYIELVESGDPLAGAGDENVGKIKLKAWKGHDFIIDPDTDVAGVGWILADNWWPYQRPSFVTPPFAGFVSGHSTYSRAAAEVMTMLTGDEYFPGGMGEFEAPKNEFLVFEDGPSMDLTLQWATYRDASDQCSLSRIWGGIHPPADDIPGRLIGEKIGIQAFSLAEQYFDRSIITGIDKQYTLDKIQLFPNPVNQNGTLQFVLNENTEHLIAEILNVQGQVVLRQNYSNVLHVRSFDLEVQGLRSGMHFLKIYSDNGESTIKFLVN